MVLIVSMSFAIAFLLSEKAGVVSAEGAFPPAGAGASTALPSAGGTGAPTALQKFLTQKVPAGTAGGTTSEEFSFTGGISKVASGKATFGFQGTTGAVAGALAQGLFWGALLYGGIKLLAPALGASKEATNALANAALAGGIGGGVVKALIIYGHGSATGAPGIFSFTAGQAGFIAGVGIAIVVFMALYKKEKKQLVRFECLPWEPQLGGAKCEECNKDGLRPCSEYRCKSLGQACQLLNAGTGKEQCVWVSKNDVESPTITPWAEPLRPVDAKYIPDTSVRPTARGVKIVRGTGDGCLDAFTPLQFGITTNEPAQCKVDYNHTQKFDAMQYYFGGDNFYAYNHTQKMRLPSPSASDVDLAPLLRNDGSFSLYVRCRDANGNENVDEYSMSFCVNKGPDTTPPVIEDTSIISGRAVQYNAERVPIEVYVNEPADCKWSTQSKAYEDMENAMQCASDVSQINAALTYTCSGNLTGIKNREENVFYFRCKDQPGKEEKERNVMVQSHELKLKGSQPLTIDSIAPNGTLAASTSTVPVTLRVVTSNGAEEGKAICSFSNASAPVSNFVAMFETSSYQHAQQLSLPAGTYAAYVRCVDAGGNAATASTTFNVNVDKQAPRVTRVYRDQALKVVTDEEAECRYSLNSCNFAIVDGLRMAYPNLESKSLHYADWKSGVTYYIRCTDAYGNEPEPATCSVIAKPTELAKTGSA